MMYSNNATLHHDINVCVCFFLLQTYFLFFSWNVLEKKQIVVSTCITNHCQLGSVFRSGLCPLGMQEVISSTPARGNFVLVIKIVCKFSW